MNSTFAALLVTIPACLSAQTPSGIAGGMLSERASYVAFFGARSVDGTPELVVLLRGQSGWQSSPAERPGYMTSRSSSSIVSSDPAAFATYRIGIGAEYFELGYQAARRVLGVGSTEHHLDNANLIVIDRVDGVGGAPTILRSMRATLPTPQSRSELVTLLSRLPELREFLR